MKIVYPKAVLLGTKKEYEPIVEIDLESIICPKPISRIDYPYGCSGSCLTNGNFDRACNHSFLCRPIFVH